MRKLAEIQRAEGCGYGAAADIQAKERQDDFDKDKLIHEGRLREMQMDAADEARQGGGIE